MKSIGVKLQRSILQEIAKRNIVQHSAKLFNILAEMRLLRLTLLHLILLCRMINKVFHWLAMFFLFFFLSQTGN